MSVRGGVLASPRAMKTQESFSSVLSEEIAFMFSSVIQNTFLQPKSKHELSMVVSYIFGGQHTGFISE